MGSDADRSRPTSPSQHCSKTELSSRESDDHLQEREAALLRQKNKKLEKDIRAKQRTISELLKTLGRINAERDSSAAEDNDIDIDDTTAPPAAATVQPAQAPSAEAEQARAAKALEAFWAAATQPRGGNAG